MEHLPPVGWADVATKRDLGQEVALLRSDLAHVRAELTQTFEASLHREVSALKSTFVWTTIASQATFASVILAAVKLL